MKPKLLTRLLAAAFFAASTAAGAAGLGKLTVLSSLGQPLRAEVDLVSVQKDELGVLAARVASPDAYQQAGIEYNPALPTVKLTIEKRPSGQPFIKITSTQAVNEPFLDLLIELNSASGKLAREYTVLMDPPGSLRSDPVAPVAAVAQNKPPVSAESPKAVQKTAPRGKSEAAPASSADGNSYGPVKAGDTLSSIARATMPGNVSLDQMLVALFRSNPEAFVDGNMNRLKAGKILRVPDAGVVSEVERAEASKEVKLQATNWHAYRQQLAGEAPAGPEGGTKQVASGKVTAMVEDQVVGNPSDDVLKLSKSDTGVAVKTAAGASKGAKASQERVKALEEELTAREKALQEANERVSILEKSVQDMQKLLEIKSPAGTEMQKQAATTAKPADASKLEVAKPAETVMPSESKPAEAPKPVEAMKPEEKAAASPADAKPAEQAAAKPKPKVVVPTPTANDQGLMDSILAEPLYLAGGAGVLALLAGLFLVNRRKNARTDSDYGAELTEYGTSGSGAVIAQEPKAGTVLSAAASADEMGPLDEATKYLALGRDAQAEEVLKEGLRAHPGQPALLLKLLEVYGGRKDKRAFQASAQELLAATGGNGEIWAQAARMGYDLDPQNPMFATGRTLAAAGVAAVGTATSDLDFDLDVIAPKGPTETDINIGASGAVKQAERTHLMQDQEVRQIVEQPMTSSAVVASLPGGALAMPDFDLDEAEKLTSTNVPVDVSQGAPAALDINFDFPAGALTSSQLGSQSEARLDLKKPATTPTSSDILDFDLSGISLDLDNTATGIQSQVSPPMKDDHWFDVQTKFDLAKAYQEMGDKDSAREILKEVVDEGDGEQQAEAKAMLESLV